MRKLTLTVGLLGAASLIGVAVAQTISVPTVPNIGPTDLIQVIPNGAPRAGNVYAPQPRITGTYGYYKSTPSTGFTYTFATDITKAIFLMTTTLSTGSVTMPASPVNDGKEVCFSTKNIITTLTVSANTGQTMADNAAAATAAGHQCYLYSLSNATWNRSE